MRRLRMQGDLLPSRSALRRARQLSALATREASAVPRMVSRPLLTLAILALAGVLLMYSGLRFQLTPSLPRGLYREVEGTAARGAIVIVCLPTPATLFALDRGYLWPGDCDAGGVPIGKVILAVAGDTIALGSEGITVNNLPVPNSRPVERDRQGRPLKHYPFGRYLLGQRELWLFSPHHPLSFDSRYFGPVHDSSVVSRLAPVWTTR